MIVVHIESGLGNQMLGYLEYLAIKQSNPSEECYIETIIYDIEESHKVINMWNGYELNKIFGIDAPNIKEYFSEKAWNEIINDVKKSEFWNDNWNYSDAIVNAFARQGLKLTNRCVSHGSPIKQDANTVKGKIKEFLRNLADGIPFAYYATFRDYIRYKLDNESILEKQNSMFKKNMHNTYCGFTLHFQFHGYGIEKIQKNINSIFTFPEIIDSKNKILKKELENCNSIAIHARRGDMLTFNGIYYKNGYFKRAIRYIKKNVHNPVFYFFCDPGSIEWCKSNGDIFGLDYETDNVNFVDWNIGSNSYIDMQMMSYCKHQVITISSFGWWATFLNNYNNKITISPGNIINTNTHV